MPFAPPGSTRRYEGREKFLAFATPGRAAFVQQFTIEEVRSVAIHETTDPEVIVVEYELAGTINATGRQPPPHSSEFSGRAMGRWCTGGSIRTCRP